MKANEIRNSGSFRDPSGLVFTSNGTLFRQINHSYSKQYRHLIESGLYRSLLKKGWLVSHAETDEKCPFESGFLVIRPERIPFISYPYEWSFSALQDAAVLTLKIHRLAMEHGMILKDASAFNVQFVNGKPIFIDTLSFDFYVEDRPWIAYGQFCRHFLAPLLLMAHVDVRLNHLLSHFIDGIPIDLADKILKGRGGFFARQHIRWQAAFIAKYADTSDRTDPNTPKKEAVLSKRNHLALIDSMMIRIEKLRFPGQQTEWGDYTALTSYAESGAASKKAIVTGFLNQIHPRSVWDLGSNDGTYSLLASHAGAQTIAFDGDPVAVDRCYRETRGKDITILPLLMDLTNPSGSIGFAGKERMSMRDRARPDCIMMLAVIHHLTISDNVPFDLLAEWLSEMTDHLIIEFVPKTDVQVRRLLSSREDIFDHYTQEEFESAFSRYWTLSSKKAVEESARILYLYEK
ncbi:MAG: class I SAM-dependent methyltransferase [Clostridiales bacterium]|nr:class I SAM-dependent methyltransferase [Clostridiales bacterium]